jgi:Flp pilus assembly protein TadG
MAARLARGRRRGAAAVEFALLTPIIMVLGAGTIEWGYYLSRREIVVSASQEACLAGVTATSTGTYDATAKTAGKNVLNAAGLNGAGATITTSLAGSVPNLFTVTISVPYQSIMGVSLPTTVAASHTMLMEQ